MIRSRLLTSSVIALAMATACTSEPEADTARSDEALTLSSPILSRPIAIRDPILRPPSKPPRVLGATLQMTGDSSATLALRADRRAAAQFARENGEGATFALQLGDNDDKPIGFNDQGIAPDLRAGEGVFAGTIPLDPAQLRDVNAELAQKKLRSIVRFAPGTRLVAGREEVLGFDLEGLKLGRPIELPRVDLVGPLRTLGGGVSVSDINEGKSLLVTALPVIEDPTRTMNPCRAAAFNTPLKKWTFGYLMTEMAQSSGLTPAQFVERWLETWKNDQTVMNGAGTAVLDGVSAAASAQVDNLIINPWRARSGGGPLDLAIAPFRLLAIVYRPDLGESSPYSGSSGNNPGELRFVFGLMNVRDNDGDGDALDPGDICQQREMSVIFEYGVPISSCTGIKQFANDFAALSALLPGTAAYGAALEALTEQVVKFGAAPTKPNQNALNQLRTNEIDLSGIWQMREFVVFHGGGPLIQTTVKNNPREHQAAFTSVGGVTPVPIDLNGTDAFRDEVLANVPALLAGTYAVPELRAALPFLGGASTYNFNTVWNHPDFTGATASQQEARFRFSLNTCSGCHTGETLTSFYHIRPSGPGSPPTLSSFLTTSPFVVTDVHGLPHTFAEMDLRKQKLAHHANLICGFKGLPPFQILEARLGSVH